MNGFNKNYTEKSLGFFSDDIVSHLMRQIGKDGSPFLISISPDAVKYSAFEDDELNTVQKTLILLIVAVSNYDDGELIDKGVVTLPENPVINEVRQQDGGDLFEEFPITPKLYCLYKAYHTITDKLSERNTPLFRILYICTCLELWRMQVPPEIITGPIGKDVHWGDLILQLTGGFSQNAQDTFRLGGYGGFISILKQQVQTVAEGEIPENVIRELYARIGVGAREQTNIVRNYLERIMRESR